MEQIVSETSHGFVPISKQRPIPMHGRLLNLRLFVQSKCNIDRCICHPCACVSQFGVAYTTRSHEAPLLAWGLICTVQNLYSNRLDAYLPCGMNETSAYLPTFRPHIQNRLSNFLIHTKIWISIVQFNKFRFITLQKHQWLPINHALPRIDNHFDVLRQAAR